MARNPTISFAGTSPSTHASHAGEETESVAFTERLAAAVGKRSVRSVAGEAGLSEAAVRQYLSGRSEPTRPKLLKISRVLGVRTGWLMEGEGPMRSGSEAGLEGDRAWDGVDLDLLQIAIQSVDQAALQAQEELGAEVSSEQKAEQIAKIYRNWSAPHAPRDFARMFKDVTKWMFGLRRKA